MATPILIASFICSIASFISFVMIVIAAFEDEIWKGLIGFLFLPYLVYWAIVEYYDEGKWPRVITWLAGSVLSTILFVAYFYVRLPSR
jgi:hypothetical protein